MTKTTINKKTTIMTSITIATLLLVGFSVSPSSFAAIDSVVGNVVEIAPPTDVSKGALEDSTNIVIFQEKENYALTADVDVEITLDGLHNAANPALSPATLSTGDWVNSYYIHADKVGAGNTFVEFSGSVTFDNDIIGVIIYDNKLDASDVELGAAGTTYNAADVNRGLDWIVNPSANTDEFTLSGNTLTVKNFRVADAQDAIRVITQGVPPNEVPDCSAAEPSQALLWPPNHKFVPITIDGITDGDGDSITVNIDGIYQDEDLNAKGKGDGNTSPDGVIDGDTAEVRAERSGTGDGRVYEISFTADDGNDSCTGSVLVGVPHDKKDTPVDSLDRIDSTG